MGRSRGLILLVGTAGLAAFLGQASAQDQPPTGYFDIPAGFDFPADKATLEAYRAAGNMPAQRLHAWNVYAGMTQPTPDGKFAIFETWYSKAEAFEAGPTPQATGPRRVVRRFAVPDQFQGMPGEPAPEAAGNALLSEVMVNFANFHHIRAHNLYLQSELVALETTGADDPKIPNNKTVPPFPPEAISLKTIWWPIAKDQITPLPIWDAADNPQIASGNPYSTWKRVVAVDPMRMDVPAGETMTIAFHGDHPDSHVVSLKRDFHFVELDAQAAANAMANGRLAAFVGDVLGRPLAAGDYAAFLGTHVTTKEIDDWVWATFWWHDRPNDGPFAADRPAAVTGVWRNYLMSVAFDLNVPREVDGQPLIAYNPWLEAHFRKGLESNCMNCHNRAGTKTPSFRPIMRGDPDLVNDPAYAPGGVRTDFLWSILFGAQ